jgi:ParB family transcriptional regulator, chromosome partitioning protein
MTSFSQNDPHRPRLGRGLAALLGDLSAEPAAVSESRAQRRIPIEHLRANALNPRKSFEDGDLEELAESIRKRGVLQPIIVRKHSVSETDYEIVAGERRWRAAQMAGLFDVPVTIVEATDRQALEIAIVENVQRTDLNAIDEALGYQRLCTEFGYSHGDLAKEIGKSRSHVANTLRLLNLPPEARRLLAEGRISAGHARTLLGTDDAETLAKRIAEDSLSVRQAEQAARSRRRKPDDNVGLEYKGADLTSLSGDLSRQLGVSVSITASRRGARCVITLTTSDQLDYIVGLLRGSH